MNEHDIEIRQLPERHILYVERRADADGDFDDAGPAAIHALMDFIQQHELPVDYATFMGITPDDMRGDRSNARFWAAVEMDAEMALPPSTDVHTATLAGGRELVYTMRGSYDGLPAAWTAFEAYRAAHNYPFRGPSYEAYVDEPLSTPEAELRTELHLPLHEVHG